MENLKESSLSRIYQQSQDHDTGMITAFRYARDCGNGEVYTKAENRARNKSLKAKLLSKGYGVTPVKGAYIENYGSSDAREVGEESFFVVDLRDKGNLKRDLVALGKQFEQDSILYNKSLVGTSVCPNSYPGYGKEEKLDKAVFGKSGEFLTRVRGRPFVFESAGEYISPPRDRMGVWGARIASLKEWEEFVE